MQLFMALFISLTDWTGMDGLCNMPNTSSTGFVIGFSAALSRPYTSNATKSPGWRWRASRTDL